MLPLYLPGRKNRAAAVYDLISTRNTLGEKSLYLNLGYWDGARGYDEACAALARVLAEAAGLGPGDRLLDAGFGFADQDFFWAEAFRPALIVGLNITESQVRHARRRAGERGVDGVVSLLAGSATAMPVAGGAFDRVTALETAFHYDTRADFFREAFRVLRPGGTIALADIVPREDVPLRWKDRIGLYLGRAFWQIPAENVYPPSEYRRKLEAAGFREVAIRSIRERVYRPFARFARERFAEPGYRARFDALIGAGFAAAVRDDDAFDRFDYIIASASKPA